MNKTQTLVVLVSLVMPLTNVGATPQDEQFQQIAHDHIESYLTTHPENATELGDHRFDDKLTDYSAEARVQELARAKQTRQQLEGLTDLSQLTGSGQAGRAASGRQYHRRLCAKNRARSDRVYQTARPRCGAGKAA